MPSNKEISRLLSLYAELLQLHQQKDWLAALLAGASYRIRQLEEPVTQMPAAELNNSFRPEIAGIIKELHTQGSIADLEELILIRNNRGFAFV